MQWRQAEVDGEHETAALGWLLGAALIVGEGDGGGRATYEAVVSDGEHDQARIRLRLEIESKGKVRERLAKLADTLGSGQSWLELAERIQVEHRVILQGVFYWDLDAGRAVSLDLQGRTEVDLEIDLNLAEYGFTGLGWRLVTELRGELELEVEGEAVNAE